MEGTKSVFLQAGYPDYASCIRGWVPQPRHTTVTGCLLVCVSPTKLGVLSVGYQSLLQPRA